MGLDHPSHPHAQPKRSRRILTGRRWQALCTAPLPVISVVLWASYNGLFRTAQKVLSLRAATDLDWRDQVTSRGLGSRL